jgi:hypothetical protein
MELLGDTSKVEARFGLFGDCAILDIRYVHSLRLTCSMLGNHFVCTRWNSLVTWVKWMVASVHLEILLISTQDRCTVCTERVIGSQIVFGASDGTPR